MSIRNDIIAGLIAALDSVKSDSSYPIVIFEVSEYIENYMDIGDEKSPFLMVNDSGVEELKARKDNDYKYALTLPFIGYVRAQTATEVRKQLNDIHSFIKQFISSTAGSDIHTNCQAIEYVAGENHWTSTDEDTNQGNLAGVVVIGSIMRYKILDNNF